VSLALPGVTARQAQRLCRHGRGMTVTGVMLLLLGVVPAVQAQNPKPATPAGSGGLALPLPSALPDGRVLRPIGVFQSQLVELIPDHFEPVSLDSFREAISQLIDHSRDDQTSRLRSSVYWIRVVDGTLVSDRSVIDIETDQEGVIRRSLGKINLAIESPTRRDIASVLGTLPRLESEADGIVSVVFRASQSVRSGIEFKWRLRGQDVGLGHDFLMRLPRCPQTRIVLSAPSELQLESLDGVLRSRPGPPPDAGEFLVDSNSRWYEIDAGGLTTVRLRTRRENPSQQADTMVVRRTLTQFQVDAGGYAWNSRIALEVSGRRVLPPLVLGHCTLTSIQVNGLNANYTVTASGDHFQRVLIDLPGDETGDSDSMLSVTVTGKGTWDGQTGWCDLPMPTWLDEQISFTAPVDEVQLIVPDSLQILSWELPRGWKQKPGKVTDNMMSFDAQGPPIRSPVAKDRFEEFSAAASGTDFWQQDRCRVRLSNQPAIDSGTTLLQVDASTRPLQAKTRMSLEINPDRVEPLRIELQRGWSLDSATLAGSGREVEISERNNANRSLVIWPDPGDLVDGKLVIDMTGVSRSSLAINAIPATWFVRARGVRSVMTAAVIAPPGMNWSGDSALAADRLASTDLTPPQREYFVGITEDSLLFRPDIGRTPPLSLQSPGVSFDVSTSLYLQRDGAEVIESLVIATKATSQVLPNLSVQTGAANGRPPYRWLLRGKDGSPPISLPSSDVTRGEGDTDDSYTIDLSDRNLRDRELVARRRFAMDGDLSIQLPSVPKAASQRSEVHLGEGLVLKENSPSVLKVPVAAAATPATAPPSGDQSTVTIDRVQAATKLRYDAVKQPRIVVAKSDQDPSVTIVWRESIRIVASSRGTDRIEAVYDVSAVRPFRIKHDPELQLVAIYRDNEPVDLSSVSRAPIELQPGAATETIRVVWNRNQIGSGWYRRCRIPPIRSSGVIVKSEYQLIASSDTFAPAALLQTPGSVPGSIASQTIAVSPESTLILIRRNTTLATGWLLAAIVFSACWYISQRSVIVVTATIALMVAAACLWWPWHLAIIGWLVVPATAAVLLVAATAWTDGGSLLLGESEPIVVDDVSPPPLSGTSESARLENRSSIVLSRTTGVVVLMLASASVAAVVRAQQETVDPLTLRRADPQIIDVLVPVDKEGALSGNVVYIPKSVYFDLFGRRSPTVAQPARFQSADYRIRIGATLENSETRRPLVEADYLIHIEGGDRASNRVRMPIAATTLRHIELVGDVNNLVQFKADSTGQVVVRLPRGDAFRLRLTLNPAMSESDSWDRLFLSIPTIAASRLTVESDQNLTALRVGGPSGRLLNELDPRLWQEEIGTVDSLEVEYQRSGRSSATVARPLQRRYWVNLSKEQASINCEVDPPTDMQLGQILQLVVRDSQLPIMSTQSWALSGSELVSPSRRLVTLECLSDSPGPVRFLWTKPIDVAGPQGEATSRLQIPEVILPALGENAEAWIAIDADPEVRVAAADRETTESLSVDHFLAAWNGFRGRKPQRAMIALERFPDLRLQLEPTVQANVDQQHHLHVTADQLQLNYSATLNPGDFGSLPRTLRLPLNLRLTELTVDGQSVANRLVRSGQFNEVALGPMNGSGPSVIEARAIRTLGNAIRNFTLPQLAIMPLVPTTDRYDLSRSRDIAIRGLAPTAIPPQPETPRAFADSLVEGWIPVATWLFQSGQTESQQGESGTRPIAGRFRVTTRQARFDCNQMISLSWVDGEWTMQAIVQLDARRIPDYVDVEIPSRWCDELEVSPSITWVRSPAIDPSLQIVRILCDAEQLSDQPLTLSGRLDDTQQGRVSVPDVKVLGSGLRVINISVPNRLTNEAISWRTSAVEAKPPSVPWKDELDLIEGRSTFSAANPDWSVELAPLPQADAAAVALTSDTQVYPQDDGALVVCRWDLIPGGYDWVDIELPAGAVCLGAWTAGHAVAIERSNSPQRSASSGDNVIRLPLSLSRLAQPVEVLTRVPVARARDANYRPKLINVPVQRDWLAVFSPNPSTRRLAGYDAPMRSERALSIGRSVVEAVEQSIDSLAELPRDEIAIWLGPWVSRYRSIAQSVRHQPVLDDESLPTAIANDDVRLPVAGNDPDSDAWAELDARLAIHVSQYLATGAAVANGEFSLHEFDGYTLHRVKRISASEHPLPVQPASTRSQGLRTMITNLLTLALVGGLLACLWPARHYAAGILVHPAFWLAAIGVTGFFVAPVPVAAAVVLTAVALPVFPARPGRAKQNHAG
jgi:hypothetical protein